MGRLVEARGVEPLSENTSEKPSPSAAYHLHSLTQPSVSRLKGLVASFYMTQAKLIVFTFTAKSRPRPRRGTRGMDGSL